MLAPGVGERRDDDEDLAVAPFAAALDLPQERAAADGLVGDDQNAVDGVLPVRDLRLVWKRARGSAPEDGDAHGDLDRQEEGAEEWSGDQRQGDDRRCPDRDRYD